MQGWVRAVRSASRAGYQLPGACYVAEFTRRFAARRYASRTVVVDDFDAAYRFNCQLGDHIGSQVFWSGMYSPDEILALRRLLSPTGWMVDVGANIGVFTLCAARITAHGGRVFAFEPDGENFARLAEHVAENGLDNVQLFRCGLSDHGGDAPLFAPRGIAEDGTYNRSMCSLFAHDDVGRAVGSIELKALDEILAPGDAARIELVKMDIEGGELPALRGMAGTVRTGRPALILELNPGACAAAGYRAGDIAALLASWGYTLHEIVPTKWGRRPKLRLRPLPADLDSTTRNVIAVVRDEHRRVLLPHMEE